MYDHTEIREDPWPDSSNFCCSGVVNRDGIDVPGLRGAENSGEVNPLLSVCPDVQRMNPENLKDVITGY